jgi:hypothetical protein
MMVNCYRIMKLGILYLPGRVSLIQGCGGRQFTLAFNSYVFAHSYYVLFVMYHQHDTTHLRAFKPKVYLH